MGAWIETFYEKVVHKRLSSHPVWVRGLKLIDGSVHTVALTSHPVWVRGLKLIYVDMLWIVPVAPRVGAWIETI